MKYLFVFLAAIFLHTSTAVSAQEAKLNRKSPLEINVKLGNQSGTFKRFAIFDLPGFYTDYSVRSLGLEVARPIHKNVSLTANYTYESGDIQKIFGSRRYFGEQFSKALVSALTSTPIRPDAFASKSDGFYTAQASIHHFHIGAKAYIVARKKFRLFSAVGYGLSGGKATIETINDRKVERKIKFRRLYALTPLGMELGNSVHIQVSLGILDAQNISLGAGVRF